MLTQCKSRLSGIAGMAIVSSLLAGGAAEGALLIAPLESTDRVVGATQTNGETLGYYASSTAGGLIGVSGSSTLSNRTNQLVVFGFQLPALPAGQTITGVTLHYEIIGNRDHNNEDHSLDTYLLDSANPDGSGTSFYYHGPSDPSTNVEFVGSTYIAVGTAKVDYTDDSQDQSFSLTGDALALLQSFYGGDGTPDQAEAFFRFNFNKATSYTTAVPNTGSLYQQYFVDVAADEAWLEITTVPEPTSLTLLGLGATGRLRRRR